MHEEPFPWGHKKRYNDLSTFLKKQFGERVQKISVNAGFTCPNRDGTKGRGGCSYCNNRSFTPGYGCPEKGIRQQVQEGIGFFSKKYDAMKYLAFFQSYSNTYASLEVLKKSYSEALDNPLISGLVIATRPDCITSEIAEYLAELNSKYFILLEFGIESHRNETLNAINRGHTFEESVQALKLVSEKGILTCAHLILGLPGETRKDWMDQADIISNLPVDIVKLHQLQIHKGTRMEAGYRHNPDQYHLFQVNEYIEVVIDYLERLNPRIIVDRFVSQAPPEMVVAPYWAIKNFEFVAKVEKRLDERDTWQGRLYKITPFKDEVRVG